MVWMQAIGKDCLRLSSVPLKWTMVGNRREAHMIFSFMYLSKTFPRNCWSAQSLEAEVVNVITSLRLPFK